MHECMDSILRDTQKGLDDQDRESQRYRYSSLRKHKFITESIYHAGALALVCQFAVWYKNCARAGGPGTEHVNNNNNNLSVNFIES